MRAASTCRRGARRSRCSWAAAARATRRFMRALRRALPGAPVEPFDAHGVPADAAEAMAFALLGRNALLGMPNHLPRCTGARARARCSARSCRAGARGSELRIVEPVVRGFEARSSRAVPPSRRRGGSA